MFHGLTKRINIVTVVLTPIPNCSLAPPNEAVFEENESKSACVAQEPRLAARSRTLRIDNKVKLRCQSLVFAQRRRRQAGG